MKSVSQIRGTFRQHVGLQLQKTKCRTLQSPQQRGFLSKAEFSVQSFWEFVAEWFSAWMLGCYLLHLMQSFSFNMSSVLHENQLHIVQRRWLHAPLITSSITLCNEMLSFYGLLLWNWACETKLKLQFWRATITQSGTVLHPCYCFLKSWCFGTDVAPHFNVNRSWVQLCFL